MSSEIFESIMKYSKEAIMRAYMCRDYSENKCSCPADEEGAVCPWGCDRRWCYTTTPQDWEEVLNREEERRNGRAQEAYEATDPKRKLESEEPSNTLTWINEIPNVPGFYWMRSSLFPEPHIMNFSIEVIPLCADDFLPGIEFAGPIPEPTESRGHDGN